MKNPSYLYILVFPESNAIKIGKSNDIHNRISTLKHFWGEVDYQKSYQLSAPENIVFKLEKSLHFFLSSYTAQRGSGDGYTELFELEALDMAIRHIELYLGSGAIPSSLTRGISIPGKQPTMKKRVNKYRHLNVKNHKLIDSIIDIANKTKKINRLLIILIRRNRYFQYQYDIIDDELYFRFKVESTNNDPHYYIRDLFNFHIDDFSSITSTSIGMTLQIDNLFQFTTQLSSRPINHPLINYVSEQSKILLDKLPQRSNALTEDLPLLKLSEDGFIEEYFLSA